MTSERLAALKREYSKEIYEPLTHEEVWELLNAVVPTDAQAQMTPAVEEIRRRWGEESKPPTPWWILFSHAPTDITVLLAELDAAKQREAEAYNGGIERVAFACEAGDIGIRWGIPLEVFKNFVMQIRAMKRPTGQTEVK